MCRKPFCRTEIETEKSFVKRDIIQLHNFLTHIIPPNADAYIPYNKLFIGCHEWKINEEPWSSWGTEAIKGRIIIMKLIAKLFGNHIFFLKSCFSAQSFFSKHVFLEFGYEPVVSLCACRNISRKDSISFYPTEARKDNSKTLFLTVGDTQCLLFCGNISKSEENCIQEHGISK